MYQACVLAINEKIIQVSSETEMVTFNNFQKT